MITVPFNFDPINNNYGGVGSGYTPAAGKYAIVTVTMSVDAYGLIGTSVGSIAASATSSSDSTSFEIRLDTGNAITATGTAASASTSNAVVAGISGTSITTVSVAGNKVAEIRATATVWHNTNAATMVSTVAGTANVNFSVAEYNIIS